jgi:hypothetical protein
MAHVKNAKEDAKETSHRILPSLVKVITLGGMIV